MKNVDAILFHSNCRDGYCAFWQAKAKFSDAVGVAVNYGDPLPADEVIEGKDVLIADFSYPPEQMAVLAAKAKSVVCLDHHRSAVRKWDGVGPPANTALVFDESKSGAMLTWEWLNPEMKGQPERAPWLVRYTQDRDLWVWQLPQSKAVNAYIASRPLAMEAWDELSRLMERVDGDGRSSGLAQAAEMGGILLEQDAKYVGGVVKNAVYWPLGDGQTVPVLNTTHLHSEVGNALCQGHPFSLTYADDLSSMTRRWSFRSADGGADVSKVAEGVGGGGHQRAAGTQTATDTSIQDFLWAVAASYREVTGGKQAADQPPDINQGVK